MANFRLAAGEGQLFSAPHSVHQLHLDLPQLRQSVLGKDTRRSHCSSSLVERCACQHPTRTPHMCKLSACLMLRSGC